MYTDYIIGDGDTTSFKEVQASKPYGDLLIQKLECVGHVQKRLGTTIPDKIYGENAQYQQKNRTTTE